MGGRTARALGITTLLGCLALSPLVLAYGWWDSQRIDATCLELQRRADNRTRASEPAILDEPNAVFTDEYDDALARMDAAYAESQGVLDWCMGWEPAEPVPLGD